MVHKIVLCETIRNDFLFVFVVITFFFKIPHLFHSTNPQIQRPSKRTSQMAPTLDKNYVKDGNIKSNNNHQRLPSSRDRHTINRRLLRRTLIQCRKHNCTTKVETPSLPAVPSVVYTPIRVSDYDASTNALAIGEKNSLRIIIRRHSDRKDILFEVRKQ